MRIDEVTWSRFELCLREPLATARGLLHRRSGVLVRVRAEGGLVGLGETMPLPGFHVETVESVEAGLPKLAGCLRGADAGDLAGNLERIQAAPPALAAGLDLALHDLAGQLAGIPVAALFGRRKSAVEVSALVSADSPQDVSARTRQARAAGFRTLKLKVGAEPLDMDIERVSALRQAAGRDALLRLDANGAWSEAQAAQALDRLAVFDLQFVEQPVDADDLAAMARVRVQAPVAIAADEAVRSPAHAAEILERAAADLLVVKPAAIGGLRAAAQISRAARAAGVGIVVTSFLDSAIGVSGALHFAASLPGTMLAAGLATDSLFQADLATLSPPVEGGMRRVPAGPGLGVVLQEAPA